MYAYTILGDMYLLGQGVAQDLQKALDQMRGESHRDALISSTISFCKYTKESDPQAKNIIGKYEDAIEWLERI